MIAVAVTPFRQDAQVVGLVGIAHLVSHFSHLMLPVLFPWIKAEFELSYSELGFLMTVYFVVSGVGQALAGFVVDRLGGVPVLLTGVALIGLGAIGLALSPSYAFMLVFSGVAGLGNSVFHPSDYTILNRKVSAARIGHAYSAHGVTGSLGWAIAPALLVPLALAFSWRAALGGAALLSLVVWLVVKLNSGILRSEIAPRAVDSSTRRVESSFAFLAIPAVWMCFLFFFGNAFMLSGIQSFASEAARQLHDLPVQLAAMFISIYMIASAIGMIGGGFLAADPRRCERVIAFGFSGAAAIALLIGFASLPVALVPVLIGLMGLGGGLIGPSRDLLVKQAAPANATGRVFGVVYSGLDTGMAIGPLVYGAILDAHQPRWVWALIAVIQVSLIFSAFNVKKLGRPALAPA